MDNKDKIIKRLLEQAKKYGYVTYEDIDKTFDEHEIDKNEMDDLVDILNDIGVKIIEPKKETKITRGDDIYEDYSQEEPMRIFLNEISKLESIDRKTEIRIAKDIRANEAKLLHIVLSSPIALREINNWVSLIQRKEMTPKELMKRGRKTKRSIKKMRKKLAFAIKSVNKLKQKISKIKAKLHKKGLSIEQKQKYQNQIHELMEEISNRIIKLDLNSDKIKRLIKKTKAVTDKIIQYINEVKKYEQMFPVDYKTLAKLLKQCKDKKISPSKFKKIVGYSVEAAHTMFSNYQKVMSKLEHYKRETDITEGEVINLNTQIKEIMNKIEQDKMKLIQANLDIVVSFAKKVSVLTGADVNDLIQEGATGLAKAVEKFEWRKGYKFSTYAHWWIKQAISRYMADYTKTIRLPVHIRELVSKMVKVYRNFQYKSSREISTEDYTKALKVSSKKIIDTLSVLVEPISSFTPRGQDEDSTIQDFIPDTEDEIPLNSLFQSYKREVLEYAMEKFLDERERKILKMRYGFDGKEYTLEEVGRIFNITRERVRQIEAKAIRKLRSPEAMEKLKEIYPIKI